MNLRNQKFRSLLFGFSLLAAVSFLSVVKPARAATNTDQPVSAPAVVNSNTAEAAKTPTETASNTTEADPGLLGLFGLNWKLFLAQLINFGIILFVLWKWVWGPVTKGLSERSEKIANSLEEAEKISRDRAEFETWKQGEVAAMRQEAAAILTEAKQSAEALRLETIEQTKAEQAKLLEQTQTKLNQEKEKLINDAKQELVGLVITSTEVILQEKLDAKKDQALIDKTLKQLK